jgi:hypothetical protein
LGLGGIGKTVLTALLWLAVERASVGFEDLVADLGPSADPAAVGGTLDIQCTAGRGTLVGLQVPVSPG